jgi:hypothetical protein
MRKVTTLPGMTGGLVAWDGAVKIRRDRIIGLSVVDRYRVGALIKKVVFP